MLGIRFKQAVTLNNAQATQAVLREAQQTVQGKIGTINVAISSGLYKQNEKLKDLVEALAATANYYLGEATQMKLKTARQRIDQTGVVSENDERFVNYYLRWADHMIADVTGIEQVYASELAEIYRAEEEARDKVIAISERIAAYARPTPKGIEEAPKPQ